MKQQGLVSIIIEIRFQIPSMLHYYQNAVRGKPVQVYARAYITWSHDVIRRPGFEFQKERKIKEGRNGVSNLPTGLTRKLVVECRSFCRVLWRFCCAVGFACSCKLHKLRSRISIRHKGRAVPRVNA